MKLSEIKNNSKNQKYLKTEKLIFSINLFNFNLT